MEHDRRGNILQFIHILAIWYEHLYMNRDYIGHKQYKYKVKQILVLVQQKSNSITNLGLQILDVTDPYLLSQCPHVLYHIISD